jgi:NAD+ diphosphatase
MIGFTAEYDSGEINVDGKEIVDAKWFDVDEVTPMPSKISISSELIEWYTEKYSIK